jgi:hypothetical protein
MDVFYVLKYLFIYSQVPIVQALLSLGLGLGLGKMIRKYLFIYI